MSTKNEPTPGEWFADDLGYVRERVQENAIGVAFDDAGEGMPPIAGFRVNARLFAASKDLLAACIEALPIVEAACQAHPGYKGLSAAEMLRAAIEKARG